MKTEYPNIEAAFISLMNTAFPPILVGDECPCDACSPKVEEDESIEVEIERIPELGWNFNEDIHFAKVVNIGGEQAIKIGFDIIRLKNPQYVEPLVNAMRNANKVDLHDELCSNLS